MKKAFAVLISVLLLAAAQNTNAQEVEYKNNIVNENVNFLQFYDNEMFH